MSRRDEFKSVSKNPAKRFLDWKSNDKCFSFYDKENSQNVEVALPFKFLVLKEMHTVKGWDDKSESGIYANEVENIGKDPMTVKAFKGGTIAKGIYKEIKEVITQKGAHYSKSIYIMDENGEIANIQLKGAAVQAWGEFTQKSRKRLGDEWVSVTGALDMKKGSVKYSVPVFAFSGTLDAIQDKNADARYAELKDYFDGYLSERDTAESEPVEKTKPFVDVESKLFEKIKEKKEADPNITIETILEHYTLSEAALEEFQALEDIPF